MHAEIIFTKGMARQNHGSRLARDAGVPGRTCKGRHFFAVACHQSFHLSNGSIEKGKIAYADVEVIESTAKEVLLEMTLYQGMNRQIRKMIEFLGHNVV